jgi:YidC/Oxa1 family membrane protein insertase
VRLDLAAVSSCQPLPELLEVSVMLSLFGVPVDAAYHVVSAFAAGLAPVAGGLATAAAIVAFTMAVRLLLLPLSYRATRGMASQARLLPQVQALQKRHAGQPDRLQREVAALYRREGTGQLAGCLPALLQLPFFSVMYQLFRSGTIGGRPNGLLAHRLLDAALGSHWLSGPGPLSAQGAVFLGLFALLAVVAWVAPLVARAARPAGAAGPASQAGAADPARPAGDAGPAGQAAAVTRGLTRVLPFATLGAAAVMPLATGLYLLTTTTWTVAERAIIARIGRTRAGRDKHPAQAVRSLPR